MVWADRRLAANRSRCPSRPVCVTRDQRSGSATVVTVALRSPLWVRCSRGVDGHESMHVEKVNRTAPHRGATLAIRGEFDERQNLSERHQMHAIRAG